MIRLLIATLMLSSIVAKASPEIDIEGSSQETHVYSAFQPYRDMGWEMGLAFTGITLWGVEKWGWFQRSMHARDEHGFTRRSSTGGSDKTGHFVSAYFLARALTYSLERQSYEARDAAFYGAMASLALMTWIEIGDATSRHGLSVEDQIANTLGIMASYAFKAYPRIGEKFNIRLEYWPNPDTTQNKDLVADYSSMKHLIALRANGFERLRATPLRFLELHLGYYSRGYRTFDTVPRQRVLYTAVGLDLSTLLNPLVGSVSKVFEFYQPPAVYYERALIDYQDDR